MSWSAFCALNPRLRPRVPVWPLIPFSTGLAVCSFLFASLLDGAETARHLVFFQAVTDLTIFEFLFSILLVIDDRTGLFKALDTVAESQHVHQLLGQRQ